MMCCATPTDFFFNLVTVATFSCRLLECVIFKQILPFLQRGCHGCKRWSGFGWFYWNLVDFSCSQLVTVSASYKKYQIYIGIGDWCSALNVLVLSDLTSQYSWHPCRTSGRVQKRETQIISSQRARLLQAGFFSVVTFMATDEFCRRLQSA